MKKLHQELIKEYKLANQDKVNSRWYEQDLQDFTKFVLSKDDASNETRLSNFRAMRCEDSQFNRDVRKGIKELDKAGMFDIRKCAPINSLD